MKAIKRAFLWSLLFLLLLCLPVMGLAIESLPAEVPPAQTDLPPEAPPTQTDLPVEVPPEPHTASTPEELIAWLKAHADVEGRVSLTNDITLTDVSYTRTSGAPAVVDTGAFTLSFAGNSELWCSGLTIRGQGGAKGVVRVTAGSTLTMDYLALEAAEGGLALVQEEESGFAGASCLAQGSGAAYAQTPYIWDFEPAVALVAPGETAAAVLPATVEGRVNQNGGRVSLEDIPVVWDLGGSDPEARLRFYAEGDCAEFACSAPPRCLVVYDDGPLTFTWIEGLETSRGYTLKVDFTKPEQLPITVAQEYSFDGAQWSLYWENLVELPGTGLIYVLGKGPGEESWDTDSAPHLYIRLCWETDDQVYYSNVMRFAAESFGEGEDIGGNRGGGTGIPDQTLPPELVPPAETAPPDQIVPPEQTPPSELVPPSGLTPDPEPDREPPHRPTPEPTRPPDRTPVPVPTPEEPMLTPAPTPISPSEPLPEPALPIAPSPPPSPAPLPSPTAEPAPTSAPMRPAKTAAPVAPSAAPVPTPDPEPELTPVPVDTPAPAPEPAPTPRPEPTAVPAAAAASLSGGEGPRGPGAAAIAAVAGAVAVSMVGAALVLNPKLRGKWTRKKE